MTIRKKQGRDEEIVIHRLTVDHKTHPKLHAALYEIGIGKPRCDYIRDCLEAYLSGEHIEPRQGDQPKQAENLSGVSGGNPGDADDGIEQRRQKARELFARSSF